jgi:hypothetical protein
VGARTVVAMRIILALPGIEFRMQEISLCHLDLIGSANQPAPLPMDTEYLKF